MFQRKRINIAVLLALGSTLSGAAMAQETLERVEVTGSRIKSISLEGISPVTVVSAKDIKADGVRNVESILNNLPQVFADQGGNVVNGSNGTAAVNLRGLGSDRTLVLVNGRRLPMGSANSTSADLNQIPAQLIKRVEVLTGGASAVYGSDAVAGVVNFIMNDRFEGVQFDVNHSFFNHKQQNAAGVADLVAARSLTNPKEFQVPGNKSADGKSTDISLLMGSNFADNKGNATLFFAYKKDDALLQSERDFSACTVSSTAAGFACGGSGTNATGRIGIGNKVFTNADDKGTARAFSNATDQYNFGPVNFYQRPSERFGFNASGNYEVTDKAKVYAEFSFHDDLTVAQIAPGGAFIDAYEVKFENPLLSDSWKALMHANNISLVDKDKVSLGKTFNKPGDVADITMGRRNVEGGGRQSEFRNTSFREVIGVKGDVGKWSYDAYMIAAKVIYSQNEQNYFLGSRIKNAMDVIPDANGKAVCANGDPACVPYNIWRLNGVDKAQLDYLQTPGFRKGGTELNVQGLSLSSDLGEYGIKLPTAKSGVGVSFGLEHRKETLNLSTDAATAAGDLSGSGGPTKSLSGEYSVNEVFGEVRVPLIEGAPLAHMLSANGSYRYSDYKSGISTNTYGLGLEYAPVKMAKFRGAYQQAVRAPNLVELFLPAGNNLYDNDADPCAGAIDPKTGLVAGGATAAQCANTGVTAAQYGNIQDSPAGQYNFLAGGNPNLKPETAKSITLGMVLTPTRDLSLTVDYFDIKIKDTISSIDPTTTLSKCLATGDATFCNLINRDKLGTLWLLPEAQIVGTNQNIGSTKTSGFDFGVNYGMKLGSMGNLGLNMVGTWVKTYEVEELTGQGSYDCVGLYGANKCGTPTPEWRHKLRGTWATPWAFDMAVTWRYIDKVVLQNTSDNPLLSGTTNDVDRNLAAQNYLDVSASWQVTKGLTLSGGINNLLDKDPPITSQLATGGGNGNTYPSVYDALGRKVFLGASYKF